MKVYVNGQDIHRLTLGDVDTGVIQTIETESEGYLAALQAFVGEWKNIEAIYTVVGPGSATALRSILTVLQTIHFVQGTPLLAIEKDPEQEDTVTISRVQQEATSVETLIPVYQHSPRITISQKDALGRTKIYN